MRTTRTFLATTLFLVFSSGVVLAQNGDGAAIDERNTGSDPAASAQRCAALAELTLPELVSLQAESVAAGPFNVPAQGRQPSRTFELPSHCRVRGMVAPEVRFEVWLPEANDWNGRFSGVGGGGHAGILSYAAMAGALGSGYATASTDTGHRAPDLEWLTDPERLRDFGYRAIHEMTVKAKAVLRSFYGRPTDFSYFTGCSTGGRQGLMEAQRFPSDYDGIVSVAPVNNLSGLVTANVWMAQAAKRLTDESNLSETDLALVNETVLARCDTLDGVADGVIENPAQCDFDPGVLACSSERAGACLDAEQVETLRRLYSGPRHADTHESLFPGLALGSESAWFTVTSPGLFVLPLEQLRRTVFEDLDWDWRSFDFSDDVERVRDNMTELDAIDPDLRQYRDQGGKLLMYHGWNDSLAIPGASIAYYASVEASLSKHRDRSRDTRDFFRLFMVPGMNHCRGGVGASTFDSQRAIEDWVERGIAPGRIEASHVEDGRTTHSRPLCPYPEVARYQGSGDTNSSASFVCAP